MLGIIRRKQKGQGLVEYALILVLIAIVVIGILTLIGSKASQVFNRIESGLNDAPAAEVSTPPAQLMRGEVSSILRTGSDGGWDVTLLRDGPPITLRIVQLPDSRDDEQMAGCIGIAVMQGASVGLTVADDPQWGARIFKIEEAPPECKLGR